MIWHPSGIDGEISDSVAKEKKGEYWPHDCERSVLWFAAAARGVPRCLLANEADVLLVRLEGHYC